MPTPREPVTLPAPDLPSGPPHRDGRRAWLRHGVLTRDRLIVLALTVLAAVHAGVVARTYHVGSFDDDASYVMTARALAHLHGLTSTLPAGLPLVTAYPPGYAAILAPLAAAFGTATLPMRLLSGGLLLVLLPLTWTYLRGRGLDRWFCGTVLALMALNPVLATYGSMVMAELPFLVAFLLALLALDRWALQSETITRAGVAVVVLLPALVWIKQAGIGMAAGAVLFLLWRRQVRKALLAVAGLAVLLLPLIIARLLTSTPVLGSRYSSEIEGSSGGFGHRLTTVPGEAVSLYWHWAVSNTFVPTGPLSLPSSGPVAGFETGFRLALAPLVIFGLVAWIVRLRRLYPGRGADAAVWTVVTYVVETLVYPFTNERRVILVLPIVLAWAVQGVVALGQLLAAGWRRVASRRRVPAPAFAALLAAIVAVPLVWQFPRNYMLPMGRQTSNPGASPSMELLRRLGPPSEVVETDYVWTTSLFSGHRTRKGFFQTCYDGAAQQFALQDRAVYVLTSGFASIGIGSPCGLLIASRAPWAVRLYRTTKAKTAVFALVGPGTTRPDEADLTPAEQVRTATPLQLLPETPQLHEDAGLYPTTPTAGGSATFTWDFTAPADVRQVSLGAASATATTAVTLQLRLPDGRWRTVSSARGPVGARRHTPFLLSVPATPIAATGMRVIVTGSGTAEVHDAHALGTFTGKAAVR